MCLLYRVALYELAFVLKLSEIPQMLLTLKTGLSTTGCNSAAVFTPLIFVVSLTVQWKAAASYRTVAHFYFNLYNFFFFFILTFFFTFITGDTVVQNLYNFLSYVEQRGIILKNIPLVFDFIYTKIIGSTNPLTFFTVMSPRKYLEAVVISCCYICLHRHTCIHIHLHS